MSEEQLRSVTDGTVEPRYGIVSEPSPARLLADVDLVNTPRFPSAPERQIPVPFQSAIFSRSI